MTLTTAYDTKTRTDRAYDAVLVLNLTVTFKLFTSGAAGPSGGCKTVEKDWEG
jgi:hypothetical protein